MVIVSCSGSKSFECRRRSSDTRKSWNHERPIMALSSKATEGEERKLDR